MTISKNNLSNHIDLLEKIVYLLIIPAAVASLVIIKVFIIPDCFAFDANDDANHTFVNLFAARAIMSQRQLPMINLFNNFGTPILGDTLTYPFAVHALTYVFLPDYLAMTVNRWLIAFLTVFFLEVYFGKYMAMFSSMICALLVFISPGFLWHFAHHHYQTSVLFFVVLLILHKRFLDKCNFGRFFLFFVVLIMLWFNTSINLVCIMLPFFIFNHFFVAGGKFDRKSIFFFVVIACGFICASADILSFIKAIPASARLSYNYSNVSSDDFKTFLLRVIAQVRPWRHHINVASYKPLPVLILGCSGLALLFRKKSDRILGLKIFILGYLPVLFVLFLLYFRGIWWSLPWIRSVDITRIWWISNVFMMVSVGIALDAFKNSAWDIKKISYFSVITAVVIGFYYLFLDCNRVLIVYKVPLLVLFAILLFYWLFLKHSEVKRKHFKKIGSLFSIIISITLIAAYVPSFVKILGMDDLHDCKLWSGGHHFSYKIMSEFLPRAFLESMEPFSRLATEVNTCYGQDLKAVRGNIFGSNGRSNLLNKPFLEYLMSHNMVVIEGIPVTYHFARPWNTDKLSSLGIKYILQRGDNPELVKDGWRVVVDDGSFFLYRNPVNVGLIYFIDKGNRCYLKNVIFKGNNIYIHLPDLPRNTEMVATFVALPGWKAFVDGKKRDIYSKDDQLIRVSISPGDKSVELRYEPYTLLCMITIFFAPFLLGIVAFYSLRRIEIKKI